MTTLVSTNPAKNYKKLGSVKVSTLSEVKKKVTMANHAKKAWKELGIEKRINLIKPLYKEFIKKKQQIALLTTREIGKPISEAFDDFAWDSDYFKSFLEEGKKYLKDQITQQNKKSLQKIVYEPWGVTAVIVPWNFPFANFLWGVIPTLIAGNTVVFKHSEECPLMGKLIDQMMTKSKLPLGVFSQVYGDGKVGWQLVKQDINFIWFTGSSAVGKKLYELAGKKFIPAIMELGGSNPCVVFDDVDVDKIIDNLFVARFTNCGQVCDALKRLIVHKNVLNQLVTKLKNRVQKVKVGDPEDKKTDMGPLVAKRQLLLLESQVQDAVNKGAQVVCGGKRPKGLKGAYYEPTILTNIKRSMRVGKEEVFGPVLPAISFKTEEEAIKLANDTTYGLGAKVFSKDKNRAKRVASQIDAGCIEINHGNHWLSCNPFGGYKCSGMGREHGQIGWQQLCQVKVVSMA